MEFVTVGPRGARMGYVEFPGPGPARLFLHGLGASAPAYFAPIAADPVLGRRRAVMLDFLGFGLSDRPHDFGYTLEDHAGTVARAIEALALGPAEIVAHSMGGSVALVLAARRPELVRRLVLAEPNLLPTPRPHLEGHDEDSFARSGFADRLAAAGPDWAATMRLADPVALFRSEAALGGGSDPMMRDLLLSLEMPCHLIEGELSAEVGEDPEVAAAGIAVTTLPGAGHCMMLDDPAAFARALARFLD
ncbi:alpha/beta fold hydrolase [Acidimangrovimonas pyrenivorans]|uniref:Alpha/beta fold hydrolase n=1 Tax=Acidimangrovimonas pyrenivorans TaxID=2030798 RepID=A0ABV7ABD1_9RHOB